MASVKNLLLGKPLRAPLHPAVVHLPIALFPLSLLLDVGSWIFPDADLPLVAAAYYCIYAGIATGVIAGVLGFIDFTEIRRDHPAKRTATLHMVLNLIALGLYALSAGMRMNQLEEPSTPVLPMVISLVALGVLSYSGYLGGHLVYSDGVGVGRHRRKPRLPDATIAAPRGAGVMVPVADASALGESATLRVNLNGTVVAVARHDGQVYAFQEYCTHRYGPLSEGALKDCEVICPWHNSRFDLRTGKVTGGPAKVDLKTFRAQERDGQIWVETP